MLLVMPDSGCRCSGIGPCRLLGMRHVHRCQCRLGRLPCSAAAVSITRCAQSLPGCMCWCTCMPPRAAVVECRVVVRERRPQRDARCDVGHVVVVKLLHESGGAVCRIHLSHPSSQTASKAHLPHAYILLAGIPSRVACIVNLQQSRSSTFFCDLGIGRSEAGGCVVTVGGIEDDKNEAKKRRSGCGGLLFWVSTVLRRNNFCCCWVSLAFSLPSVGLLRCVGKRWKGF